MTQKILITGADGYFASNFIGWLATHMPNADLTAHARKNAVTSLSGDLADIRVAARLFAAVKPDIVFHFAGRVPLNSRQTGDKIFMHDNAGATRNIVMAASALANQPHILYPGTAGLYPTGGMVQDFAHSEPRVVLAREQDAQYDNPSLSPYVQSKIQAEKSLLGYPGPKTILRKPTVIGFGEKRGNFLQELALHLLAGKPVDPSKLTRCADYVAAEDVCRAFWLSAMLSAGRNQIINIGSGRAVTGAEALAGMARAAQKAGIDIETPAAIAANENAAKPGTILDIREAQALGYDPKIDFAQICSIVWKDVLEQPLPPQQYLQSLFPRFVA